MDKDLKAMSLVKENISRLLDRQFNLYFYVLDTKGNPSGSLEYVYDTALYLMKMGYNVSILHDEKEYVGVEEWLGEKYNCIPVHNVETENIDVSPSDFLFIPNIFTSVLQQTKDLPCKRVMICQNYLTLTESMPIGVLPQNYGIYDIITTTDTQKKIIENYFDGVNVYTVSPMISNLFRKPTVPQKLIVNIVAKNQDDVNRIVKPFYWMYPYFRFVSFRDLRGLNQEVFSNALREGAVTVWVDDETGFGYSALEALRSGTIVLGKLPDCPPDWCIETTEDGSIALTDSIIWFDNLNDAPSLIASVVEKWISDEVPSEIYASMDKLEDSYSANDFNKQIEDVYVETLFKKRLDSFQSLYRGLEEKNNLKK